MIDFTKHLTEINSIAAALTGATLQYLYSLKKGFRVFVVIFISTVFVALFVVNPACNHFELSTSSPIRIIALALSSLISVELVSLFIRLLPKAVRTKILSSLGVEDGKS